MSPGSVENDDKGEDDKIISITCTESQYSTPTGRSVEIVQIVCLPHGTSNSASRTNRVCLCGTKANTANWKDATGGHF